MSEVSEALMRRIGKIKALAERGVDGEKAAAMSMLENILARHNLTLGDIEDAAPVRKWVEVKFSGEHEKTLMTQIIYKVRAAREFYIKRPPKARGRFYVELSAAEHVEVEFLFALMRKALADEFEKVTAAFIHANRLFAPSLKRDDEDEDDEPDTRTHEERMRTRQIAQMAMAMSPVNVKKAISG